MRLKKITTKPETCLVTSLVPGKRMSLQYTAVQSWKDYGFDVVSLNTEEEIDKLLSNFSNITFVPQMRDGRIVAGKPVIYINNILDYLKETKHRFCGIVNSDIYFAPGHNLKDQIETMANGCLVISPRNDVSNFSEADGKVDPLGFDAFFFDRTLLPIWEQTQFCLGMPFWDHWFPIKPILENLTVKKFILTGIRHIPHSVDRDEGFFFFNDHFANLMTSYIKNNEVGFGKEFAWREYATLRTAVTELENSSVPHTTNIENFEKLAIFFDNLTKYVIRFINERAEITRL